MNRAVSERVVGVVGASARAAVHSLARAGYSAWAVDLFADRDLSRVAPCAVCPMQKYPAALPRLAATFLAGPVLYTGGLENHPEVVAELAGARELWGNTPDVLKRVRDPYRLFPNSVSPTVLPADRPADLHTDLHTDRPVVLPVVVPRGRACPGAGRWLRKPLRSAAGHGIRPARPGEPPHRNFYFQQFVTGQPMSAVFREGEFVAATVQLVGTSWLHARRFGYCGNVGPLTLPVAAERRLRSFARRLSDDYGLRGVWGIDFLFDGDTPRIVEVNPRYTASVEVIEYATGCSLLDRGVTNPPRGGASRYVGKGVYFAPRTLTFPAGGPWDDDLDRDFDPWRLPGFADIPRPGAVFNAGQPVMTCFTTGSSLAECQERLQSRAAELDQLLGGQRS